MTTYDHGRSDCLYEHIKQGDHVGSDVLIVVAYNQQLFKCRVHFFDTNKVVDTANLTIRYIPQLFSIWESNKADWYLLMQTVFDVDIFQTTLRLYVDNFLFFHVLLDWLSVSWYCQIHIEKDYPAFIELFCFSSVANITAVRHAVIGFNFTEAENIWRIIILNTDVREINRKLTQIKITEYSQLMKP